VIPSVSFARLVSAGVAAGLAFAAFSVGCYAVGGRGAGRPLNLIAHTVWRSNAVTGRLHPLPALVGLAVAAVMGIILMTPYALLIWTADISPGVVIVAGAAIYLNAGWIIGDYLVWPKIDPVAAAGFSKGVAWVGHLVAGVVGGTVLVLRRGVFRQVLRSSDQALSAVVSEIRDA
jgi:hypothetical protein